MWNLYLSWSKHPLTSFGLEINVGSLFGQKKTGDTDRNNRYFSTTRVSQAIVNTMVRNFEQLFVLQVAKCLIVHVLSSNYLVSSLGLPNGRKATQQCLFRVANDVVLNQFRVYRERVYADNVLSEFRFVRSFSSQNYSKSVPTLLPKLCPMFVLNNARKHLFFAMLISTFWVLRDTLTVTQLLLWLWFSWMRAFIFSTKSVMEG